MIGLIYILKTIVISGLLFGYYALFLKNRFFHGFNRLFLLSIPVLSFLLPALHFNLPAFWSRTASGSPIRLLGVGQGKLEEAITIYGNHSAGTVFSGEFILAVLSLSVSFILFIRFYKTIRYLVGLHKDKPFLKLKEATVYFVSEKGTPFSFFKAIFWGKELELDSDAGQQILRHELYHVKQNHSLDMLILECSSILIWFNPFLHFIHRELKAIHEYGADAYALAETDTYVYASLLLMHVSGPATPLTNPFFKNQIKRRITMMTKKQKNNHALLGRFMILPLVAVLMGLFSFKMQNQLHLFTNKTLRVVIDAGHGGIDPGSSMNGIPEKNINLGIAKKIQQLSKAYNVDVIMTRENDELPGKGENIENSLNYRAELPGKENADLFISIHTNGTGNNKMQEQYSGFDIYVPGRTSKVYDGSVKLASIIADYIKPDYSMAGELKEKTGRILVLDKATVPAILIECGYMDNKADMAYLQDEKNQEKIARDILEGIRKFGIQISTFITLPLSNQSLTNIETKEENKTASALSNIETKDENNTAVSLTNRETKDETQTAADSTAPSKKVEVEAEFPGGNEAWQKYLFKTLNYPVKAVSNEIQGTVIVEFVVKTDGTVKDVRAISGPSSLRAESVRVLRESGKWIPAMDHGAKVDSYHKQPINYVLKVS